VDDRVIALTEARQDQTPSQTVVATNHPRGLCTWLIEIAPVAKLLLRELSTVRLVLVLLAGKRWFLTGR
jgi:hypothetical protein